MSNQRAGLTNLTRPRLVKAEPTVPVEEAARHILSENDIDRLPTTGTQVQSESPGVNVGSSRARDHDRSSVPTREHLIQKMFRLPLSVVQELEQFRDAKRYGTMTDIVLRGLRPELDRIRALEAERLKHLK
jgi:hypothetical protein